METSGDVEIVQENVQGSRRALPPHHHHGGGSRASIDRRGGPSVEKGRRSKAYSVELARESEHMVPVERLVDMWPESGITPKAPANSAGLPPDVAQERLRRDGKNMLSPPERESVFYTFFKQFKNPFLLMLLLAAGLAFLGYFLLDLKNGDYENLILALMLIAVVLFTGGLSFKQEREAQAVVDSFVNMLPAQCTVMRGGEQVSLPAPDLVVGDIVLLSPGDKVPADLRMLHCTDLKVECAALTGESEPVELTEEPEVDDAPKTEARCLAFNGSLVLEGTGVGLVIATGDDTVVGTVAQLTGQTRVGKSNLEREVTRFVYFIAIVAISTATIFFTIGVSRRKGEGWLRFFITGYLLVLVGSIPQGLPTTVTSLLTLTAKKMAKKKVLIKQLDSIETLGATSVICTDKTGTLTKNEMSVVDAWCGGALGLRPFEDLERSGGGGGGGGGGKRGRGKDGAAQSESESESEDDADQAMVAARLMMIAGAVCNNAVRETPAQPFDDGDSEDSAAEVSTDEESSPRGKASHPSALRASTTSASVKAFVLDDGVQGGRYVGSPTEQAIIKFLDRVEPHERLRGRFAVRYEIPFSSKTKWHAVVVDAAGEGAALAPLLAEGSGACETATLLKGAPERVLQRCTQYMDGAAARPIDDRFRARFEKMYKRFAKRGQRVIGIAARANEGGADIERKEDVPLDEMTFLGMFGICDPPRDDVPGAVEACKAAGLRVFVVTGDHPLTARAIAEQVGILEKGMKVGVMGADEGEDGADWEKQMRGKREAPDAMVVCGWVLDAFDDDMWEEVLSKRAVVFARTTPQDKLNIVTRCQARGEVVAVTGDGVNDGPALKKADIGVAMGLCGSEVARDAANIVLMDDNFASIVRGIELGRVIWDNLKKTIAYTLTHLLPEILPVLLELSFGLPPGLSSLQILTIDLLTELGPAISLSYECAESDVMKHAPRDVKHDHLVTPTLVAYSYLEVGIAESAACVVSYIVAFATFGISMSDIAFTDRQFFQDDSPPLCVPSGCFTAEQQQSMLRQVTATWYMTLVLSQAFHIWMCKTRRVSVFKHPMLDNLVMIGGVVVELLLMALFVFVPGLNTEVMSTDIPLWWSWIPGVICGLAICVFNELRKLVIRRRPKWLLSRALYW